MGRTKMKKSASIMVVAVFLTIIMFLLVKASSATTTTAAPSDNKLQAEKLIEKGKVVRVGDDVTILLKFTNPFNIELPIKIVDKNAFGNNGIDVQCMEYTVPRQRETLVAYDPIKPLKSGKYTIDSAEVTYTNPATGKSETIKSNTLDVSVNDSASSVQQGSAQGMTAIYRCNGMNMQSTSYSSSGMQTSSQQPQSNQQQRQSESQQNRVQNNQMNQNAQAVKQQLGQQLAQQNQVEQEFQQNLAKNREFREKHENILKAGYALSAASVDPSTNDTGSFELSYKNQNGETASLKGEMENGTMKSIMSQNSENVRDMLKQLGQNAQFQNYERQLAKSGFNQSMQPIINQASQERTEITAPYKNGAGEERKITADYVNGTLQKVSLERSAVEENRNNDYLRLFLLAIMAALGWTIYSKLKRKAKGQAIIAVERKIETPLDYAKEAEEMIAEAEKLFGIRREKDAYEKVSQAVRFYYSHKLGLNGREITNTALLAALKSGKLHSDVRECLSMCGMVEFAKYEPNAEDFGKISGSARKFILTGRSSPQPASRRSGAP